MENKDQLNQIPEENKNEIQDEKTSQEKTVNDEASQQPEEIQDTKNEPVEIKEPEVEAIASEEPQQEETMPVVKDEVAEASTEKDGEEKPDQVETVVEKQPEAIEAKQEEVEPTEAPILPAETPKEEPKSETADTLPEKAVDEGEPNKVEVVTGEVEPAETKEAPVEEGSEVEKPPTTEAETAVEEKVVEEKVEEVKPVEAPAEVSAEAPKEENSEVTKSIVETEVLDEDHDDDDHHEEVHEDEIVDYDTIPREEMIEALGKLVQEEDVTKIKARVAMIKVAYLKKTKEEKEAKYQAYITEGGEKEDYSPLEDELESKFNEIFDIYRQKRVIYLENLEKEKIDNLQKKKDILEALKELIGSEETLKKTYDDFKDLQDSWKETGMVPKNEVNNLWQTYHFLVEKFFDKVKINKELKDLDLKKNLEQKIELCEKAEELLLETSILKSFKQLQGYHEHWKEIGPVPLDKKDEIWERFKSTTDKINQRRRDHYKKMQEEQQTNLVSKSALCEKAENLLAQEVSSIREWQEKTKQFDELFKVWRTVGPAPKKQNDEIWERFKGSLDAFYAEKKEYFAKIKDQQINNYNLKLDLCVQAEAMKESDDWRNTTRDLINLQKEWKNIGPVPRKHSDKIWKRFRAACDEFFNKKAEHFSSIREEESGNLKKKEDLIKKVEEYKFEGGKSDNLTVLKDFQRQWTEIGFVPFKEKDRLQNAFRDAINKQLDKLNISNAEMSLASYKNRYEVIKKHTRCFSPDVS